MKEEKPLTTTDNYVLFGEPYKEYPARKDVADCCISGKFFNCPHETELGLCPIYMAQRCATKWDEKCDAYVADINNSQKIKSFIEEVARHKYCSLSSDSNCVEVEQPFDPTAQESPKIKITTGNEVYNTTQDGIDIGWYGKETLSPDLLGRCKFQCDASKVEESDPIFNLCGKFNGCRKNIVDMCMTAKSISDIKNETLKEICLSISPELKEEKKMEGMKLIEMIEMKQSQREFKNDIYVFILCAILFLIGMKYRTKMPPKIFVSFNVLLIIIVLWRMGLIL